MPNPILPPPVTPVPSSFPTITIGTPPNTTTIDTQSVGSNTFHLPNISGTALVQQDTTGFVFIGQAIQLYGSNAGIQHSSLVANRAQYRANQFGVNGAGGGITGFKSRDTVIRDSRGIPGVGCIGGDILLGLTAIGITPDTNGIPLAGTMRFQVPSSFVAAAQNYLPAELSLALAEMTGPTNSIRQVFKVSSEGETQTLRGIRAGGSSTNPATLNTGSLWSSGVGSPEGVVIGNPGDLYTNTSGGIGNTLWVKESGVNDTGWAAK